MSILVLELRQGDLMVVNGAPIRFRTRARLELTAHARFLFGKQIMPPEAANTPARRVYFALQTAYVGTEEERAGGLAAARRLVAEFGEATTSAMTACNFGPQSQSAAGGATSMTIRSIGASKSAARRRTVCS